MTRARRKREAQLPELMPLPPLLPPPISNGRLAVVAPGPDVLFTPRAAREVEEWVAGWLAHERLAASAIAPPGPLLLHGPPGTGKTAVTRMVASRMAGVRHVLVMDAMRVTESYLGATSANIASAADAAISASAVLVLEEIDALASSRLYGTSPEVENTRATTSIMRVLELPGPILLTSNRIDVIDAAVLRRCEYVVEMPDPTPEQRVAIVARELGESPRPFDLTLTRAIPLARRARRTAVLNGCSPADTFEALVAEEQR